MARNDQPKSLGEAKRRPLAARIYPVPAVPEPRDLSGAQRKNPAAGGELQGPRIDKGEKVRTPPFEVLTFPTRDESAQPSKQGRPRRRYEAEERRQVADTRKRGACGGCRASKTKCLHGPSKMATEKYRIESQSHELFALGLTTPSLTANEDEHKQVMEETIAAFDDKLVKAQKDLSTQDNEANKEGGIKATAVAGPKSPPDIGPTSQQQYPVEVHHTQPRQNRQTTLEEGMGMFKLKDAEKRKSGRKEQPTKGSSKAGTAAHLGMKRLDAHKPSAGPQPIVLQHQPIGSAESPIPAKKPYNKNLSTWRHTFQGNVIDRSVVTTNSIQTDCRISQQSFATIFEPPNVSSPHSKPDRPSPRRCSHISDQDNNTMATDESMLSLGRSPTPFSEPSSSNPPSFVHLSDLEHTKSHYRTVPDSQIALWSKRVTHEQAPAPAHSGMELDDSEGMPSSFVDYLNADWDSTTLLSKSTTTDFETSQSGITSPDGTTSKAVPLEPKPGDITDAMEIDT